jgi:signal transduction histidine kinase
VAVCVNRIGTETSKEKLQRAYEDLFEQSRLQVQIESQLRQAHKLHALDYLASGVAHDLNNMLAIIVASLNLLRRKFPQAESEAEILIDAAEEGAEKAARLARRLLSFSREQPLDPRICNINRLITGMQLFLQQTIGPKNAVDLSLADGLYDVCVDAHELENALLNLAVNATDAMPQGGRLWIKTENIVFTKADVPLGINDGPYAKIIVSDTGEGMSPDVAARALDPFFTTKVVGKGTGLGLAQVHAFTKRSKGELILLSEVGKGTSVSMLFPRFLGEATATATGNALQRAKPAEAILIVDDDSTARRLMVLEIES